MKSFPFKVFITYILLTLSISFWGPKKYYGYNKMSVVIYIFLFLLFFSLGYFIANRYKIVIRKKVNYDNYLKKDIVEKNKTKIIKFVSISILIAFLSYFFQFLEILIRNPSSLNINNIAQNYFNANMINTNQSYSLPMIFRFFTGIFRSAAIILGGYYWKELRNKYKIILILYLFLLVLVSMVAHGTQKFLGDLIIYFIILFTIKSLDLSKKRVKTMILYSVGLITIMVFVFAIVQVSRYELLGIDLGSYNSRSDGMQTFKQNHFIFKLFGTRFGFGVASLMGYLSQGYFGLSLCLKLPFVWTYGIGNSYFMSKLVSKIFKVEEIYYKTYLNRMYETFGRDGLRTWNTIFPWLASDLTFIGTLFFFIFIAYIWQTAWLEIINYRNPVSIMLFCTLSLGLIFLPANNQLLNSIDTFITTISIIIYWLIDHKKYNYLMKFN